ncbi:hypothetical protein EPUS_01551 [Endocarpon pusillum Z07020]|uniref:INO80 complex subunit B-like conserved region domain-containing protein n=1 Tax=Endocarpon pusillum (strain Z07020 / HMAS-L-300199) TaxID=1263415 RepID=U1GUL0_ENDPU|nr:uncharacterized protein EPUS_01551 [Endocarpon pusillum Z07020]ERF75721.1 hypothetical protein EPUS_01551 [Endocarpon pusillum Z07020]
MSRPRRTAATPAVVNVAQPSITVSRSPSNSPEERRRSIKLTVKMPSSKLREVTSQSSVGRVAVNSRDTFEGGEIMTGKRSTRAQDTTKRKRYNESDDPDGWDDDSEESDSEMADLDQDQGSPQDQVSTTEEESEEEEEEDDDDEMEAAPSFPPPKQAPSRPVPRSTNQQIPRPNNKQITNPAVIVTPAATGTFKSVEEKEMEMANEEDEELSELESNGEDGLEDTNMDAEGDEDELGGEEDAEGDEDIDAEGEIDSGDETTGSGLGTPKPQTKRQRGQDEGAFLALPMEPQIKKILTADEHRMRRAEMARRRKNLSEKRNEEEKMSTINRLLKRQVPKRRGKAMNPETLEAATAAEGATPAEDEEFEVERANPLFVRWVNNKDGSRIGVPEEWRGKQVGRVFGPPPPPRNGRLVEEIS